MAEKRTQRIVGGGDAGNNVTYIYHWTCDKEHSHDDESSARLCELAAKMDKLLEGLESHTHAQCCAGPNNRRCPNTTAPGQMYCPECHPPIDPRLNDHPTTHEADQNA